MSSQHVWNLRQTAVAVAVAAVVAGVGGAAVYAATAEVTGGGRHQPFGGFGGPNFGGPGFGSGGPGDGPLHSESVAAEPGGGYTTRLTQNGTVTAVSADSVTVRSDDGYTVTYVIPADTAPPVGGENVSVEGSRDGSVTTLGRITPRTR